MEEKYGLYIMDKRDVIDFNKSKITYYSLRLAFLAYQKETMEEITAILIDGMNNKTFTDENYFYFVTNERKKEILWN